MKKNGKILPEKLPVSYACQRMCPLQLARFYESEPLMR